MTLTKEADKKSWIRVKFREPLFEKPAFQRLRVRNVPLGLCHMSRGAARRATASAVRQRADARGRTLVSRVQTLVPWNPSSWPLVAARPAANL